MKIQDNTSWLEEGFSDIFELSRESLQGPPYPMGGC